MDSDQFSDSDDDVDFVGKSASIPPPAEEDDGDDVFVKHMESVTAADRPLQLLLKHVGCKWHLKPHQFLGVRAVAGVPSDWPSSFDSEGKPDTLPEMPVQRGIAEGDDMGLGKTIMALAGGLAVRAYIEARLGRQAKPALVIAPNAAVAAQWRLEALGMLEEREIWSHSGEKFGQALHKRFSRPAGEDEDEDEATRPRLVIVTRSQLQTETSHAFRSQREAGGYKPSPLAPHLPQKTVLALQQKYNHANVKGGKKGGGKSTATGEDRMYVREGHKDGDDSTPSGGVLAIWREAQKRFTRAQHIYSIVLIDEVHELKNPHTLATMLAVAAGLHAPRVISISGTGYNNHLQDMATLHLLIDPSWEYADLHFWKDMMESPDKVIGRQAIEAQRARAEGRAVPQQLSLRRIEEKQAADKAAWERDVLTRRTKDSCGIKLPPKKHVVYELAYKPLELGMSVTLSLTLAAPARRGHSVRVALLQTIAGGGGEGSGGGGEGSGGGGGEGSGGGATTTAVELGVLTANDDAPPIQREIGLLGDEHALRFEVFDAQGAKVHTQTTSVATIAKHAFQLMESELMNMAVEAARQSAAASASAATVAAADEAKEAKQRVLEKAAKTFVLLAADDDRGVTVLAAFSCDVLPHSYLQHEKEFLKILPLYDNARKKACAPGGTVGQRAESKKMEKTLFQILMAKVTNMQMALSHPVLVGKGREASVLFASRAQQPKAKFCAICKPEARDVSTDKTDADLDPSKDKDTDDEAEDDAKDGGRREERRFDTDEKAYTRQEFIDEYGDAWPEHWRLAPKEDDDDEGIDAAGDGDGGAGGSEDKRDEPLVLLPPQCCAKAGSCTGHYAHLSCFNAMQAAGDAMEDDGEEGGDAAARPSCPRCRHLLSGLVVQTGAAFDASCFISNDIKLWDDKTPSGGWYVTPKLAKLLELTRGVAAADKLLVFSKFLGCLDLASNLLKREQYRCERFDGEVKDKTKALDRAREPEVKALLSTIRSGGVGLNLQEFNHVVFESRDLNPQKHKQAEDRVHRLGQEKDVTVVYLDAKDTFDEAVRELMRRKLDNAQAILDGKLLPKASLPSYKDVVGKMGEVLRKVIARRAGRSEDALLPTAAPKRPLADGGLGGRSKMKKRDGDVRPTTSNPNAMALASDFQRWQVKAPPPKAPPPKAPPPKAPPPPIGKSPSASASEASSSAPLSARLSAPSEAVKNSLPPHRRVSRRLKDKGVAKDRFTQARIESVLAVTGGDVDEAVAQLVAEAAGKGGGSEVFILSSSDED